MNVLWFVNVPLRGLLEEIPNLSRGSGWWLSELASELVKVGVQLTVVTCLNSKKQVEVLRDGIRYIIVPASPFEVSGIGGKQLLQRLANVVHIVLPDLIDCHGSEYIYGQIAPSLHVPILVTIQGFINAVVDQPYGSNGFLTVLKSSLLQSNPVKSFSLMMSNHFLNKARARSEMKVLNLNSFFSGRTDWDKTELARLAGEKIYFSAPRILRKEFYQESWTGGSKESQSIFSCARAIPGKGFDDLIKVLPHILNRFRSVRLRITCAERSAWGNHLARLARLLGVYDRVDFLGYLSSKEIIKELKSSSAFAYSSYVDNSPNSLAEALCLGVPSVASNVGGIPSLITQGENGLLFPKGSLADLADGINSVLSDETLAKKLSTQSRARALEVHDRSKVVSKVLKSYEFVRSIRPQAAIRK